MATLIEAYRNIEKRLRSDNLGTKDSFSAEKIVKYVNGNFELLDRVRTLIKVYGREYDVPSRTDEIPIESLEDFRGCAHWMN